MNKNHFILFASISMLLSCQNLYAPLEDTEQDRRVTVARVNDIYLYENDIIDLVPSDVSGADSSIMVNKYVDSWIIKQLTIERASLELDFNQANIERKVLDYRYALMVHEYEKFYINQHLNEEISENEIITYYNDRFENFILRQNIVRCLFAIVPIEAPQIENFRKLIRSYPNSDLEEIQSYCYRFATKSSLETELWLNFDEVITNTPLTNIQDKVTYLKNNTYIETTDEENYYFIRLLDYKISDQISPLDYIRDDIESMLVNKKKIELRKQLEDDIYELAKKNNEFEIYK